MCSRKTWITNWRETSGGDRDGEILLRKTKKATIEEIAEKIENQTKKDCIDVDKLIDEAIKWARSSK